MLWESAESRRDGFCTRTAGNGSSGCAAGLLREILGVVLRPVREGAHDVSLGIAVNPKAGIRRRRDEIIRTRHAILPQNCRVLLCRPKPPYAGIYSVEEIGVLGVHAHHR